MNFYCPACHSTFDRRLDTCPHDDHALIPADQRDDPFEGTVLDDRYRLEALLGAGGMGMVYRSTQLAVDRDVAVKLLRNELDTDGRAHERFSREAQHISSLRHPNIVQLIDFGRDAELDVWFLVMEHVEGRSLADLLSQGRLSWELALEVVYQVCAGLTASHDREMIHRDLKPDNLHAMAVADGTLQVKILDFGIARCLEQTTQLTESGVICGTPAYLAPEQAMDGDIGPETDLYALGVCLYEMVTGRLPFEADSGVSMMVKHVSESPAPARDYLPDEAPVDQLQSLLDDLLAKQPEARPDGAGEVRSRIETIRESAGRPRLGLAGEHDWERRLDELVHSRLEGDGPDGQLANRRTVDPLAMTAGTLQTIHPTFKKYDLASTREWSGRNDPVTEDAVRGTHGPTPAGDGAPALPGAAARSDPADPSTGVPVDDETAGSPHRPDEPPESAATSPSADRSDDRWRLTAIVAVLASLAGILAGVALSIGPNGGSSPEGPTDGAAPTRGDVSQTNATPTETRPPAFDSADAGRAQFDGSADLGRPDGGPAHSDTLPRAGGSGGAQPSDRPSADSGSRTDSADETRTADPATESAAQEPATPDETPPAPASEPAPSTDESDEKSLEEMLNNGTLRSD